MPPLRPSIQFPSESRERRVVDNPSLRYIQAIHPNFLRFNYGSYMAKSMKTWKCIKILLQYQVCKKIVTKISLRNEILHPYDTINDYFERFEICLCS